MKKTIVIILISFILGLVLGIGLFYNEDWNGLRKHLEWRTALRDWNPGQDSSLRQCLYYFKPTNENSAVLKPIFCIPIKDK